MELGVRKRIGTLPLGLAFAIVWPAKPVLAECTGSGCYDGMIEGLLIFFGLIAVYGLIVIALLVMLLRAKWRRAGLRALALVAAVALGVPWLLQGWQSWKLAAMERREVVGQPPALLGRGLLLIPQGENCYADACMAVLLGRGAEGAYVLPEAALDGLDLTRPIPLADLPLQFWTAPVQEGGSAVRRTLSTRERQQAADSIDYVVLTAEPFYQSGPGPVEAALRAHPDLRRMREGELLRFAMAPLEAATLSLPSLSFDILDLWLVDPAPMAPLGLGDLQSALNRAAGLEEAAKVLCPVRGDQDNWSCRHLLE